MLEQVQELIMLLVSEKLDMIAHAVIVQKSERGLFTEANARVDVELVGPSGAQFNTV